MPTKRRTIPRWAAALVIVVIASDNVIRLADHVSVGSVAWAIAGAFAIGLLATGLVRGIYR